MEKGKILQADYLDIIFDNRNKSYGGYELRKHYNRRALKAFGITCTIILFGIGTPFFLGKLNAKDPVIADKQDETVFVIHDVALPPKPPQAPEPPKPPKSMAPPPVAATVKNLPPIIMKDNNVKPDIKPPEIKDLEDKVSGPANNAGQNGDEIAMDHKLSKGPFGDGLDIKGEKNGKPDVTNDEPVRAADEMPEFPGGLSALQEYLRQNLRYPVVATEEGIEGLVVVSFIVNAGGEIEGTKVSRGIGGGCDKEALRVVNNMPKWKAGKRGGKAVKVWYTLPVNFKLLR